MIKELLVIVLGGIFIGASSYTMQVMGDYDLYTIGLFLAGVGLSWFYIREVNKKLKNQ